jgi:TPR repeat protein
MRLFRKAASLDDAYGTFRLGRMMLFVGGTKADQSKGFELCHKAHLMGCVQAKELVGKIIAGNADSPESFEHGKSLIQEAAEGGLISAYRTLYFVAASGFRGDGDPDGAEEWLLMATVLGVF